MTSSKQDDASKGSQQETIRGTQSTARLSVWVAVAIVAIALVGYLTSRSSFTNRDVERGLSVLAGDLGDYFAGTAYQAELSYDAVSLEGNIFSRRAVVSAPKLVLHPVDTGSNAAEMTIATDALTVRPAGSEMNTFTLEFEKPIKVSKGDESYEIIPQVATAFLVERKDEDGKNKIAYSSEYSENISYFIKYVGQASSAVDTTYMLRVGVGSRMSGVLDVAANSYYEEAALKDSTLEYGQTIVRLGDFKGVYEVAGHDSTRLHHYQMDASGISMSGAYEPLGELAASLELEEDVPLASPSDDRTLTISGMEIQGDGFSLSGDGDMEIAEGEILPYGSLSLHMTPASSLQQLIERLARATVIPAQSVPLVTAVLERAAVPADEEDTLNLTLQRKQGGSFLIGDTTFEELTASILRDYLKSGSIQMAPVQMQEPQPAGDDAGEPAPEAKEEAAPAAADEAPAADAPAEAKEEGAEAPVQESQPETEAPAAEEPDTAPVKPVEEGAAAPSPEGTGAATDSGNTP